jgi:CRISPR type III-A-associated RAMP protein Csm4
VLHSDTLYSAVCSAFQQFGGLEEWLSSTATEHGEPAVRFSSCFPMQRGTLFAPPPAGWWPPREAPGRLRWHAARFVPLFAINRVLRGEGLREEDYVLDGHSGCLLPAAAHQPTGPFRSLRRASAAVDRVTGVSGEAHASSCLQFAPGSGLWCLAAFANPIAYAVWAPRVEAAFRLLADSGFGGLRSRGFGRSRTPEFQPGVLPELILPGGAPAPTPEAGPTSWWLLSLFTPGGADRIHWASGDYSIVTRSGRVQSPDVAGPAKLAGRMVAEGSVLVADATPRGSVRNVAPEGCPHPVWRAGYALAVPLPSAGAPGKDGWR